VRLAVATPRDEGDDGDGNEGMSSPQSSPHYVQSLLRFHRAILPHLAGVACPVASLRASTPNDHLNCACSHRVLAVGVPRQIDGYRALWMAITSSLARPSRRSTAAREASDATGLTCNKLSGSDRGRIGAAGEGWPQLWYRLRMGRTAHRARFVRDRCANGPSLAGITGHVPNAKAQDRFQVNSGGLDIGSSAPFKAAARVRIPLGLHS
jgi:hypothetical protein